MPKQPKQAPLASNQMQYKLLLAYCLMSIMPILVGVYIASLFIQYPFEANSTNMTVVSLVTLFSLSLSFLGYRLIQQLTAPIVNMSYVAKGIAEGRLDGALADMKGVAELEELSDSLKTISNNARELLEKVEKLSLKDSLTGLYNGSYLRERLSEEIQRAVHYQQPCSLACFSVDNFDELLSRNGLKASEEALKSVAKVFSGYLSEFDRAARTSKGEFAVIFPDKNKKKVIEIADRIQKDIAGLSGGSFTVCIGISENPIDGTLAEELLSKAKERVKSARLKGVNRVEAL
ncbi:MAG: hypothetical protein A3C47_05715 [Omnitrophica bacterium RIFCSPHIGHO2_02_FULL_51_18]|nr:MAG: hypothetical protein A3C47_05715 [Omnitrophica bacterium RIFCSPHIGHO2_02_FULL_51_18]